MSAGKRRREEDLRRLRELAHASQGRIRIDTVKGEPARSVSLTLQYRSATDDSYPLRASVQTQLRIDFPGRYPMVAPKASFLTPVFHPNVYTSGLICLGNTWLATEMLDALVRRIVRLLTFDPLVTGGEPPANRSAMLWYKRQRLADTSLFPTERVAFAGSHSHTKRRANSGVRFDETPESARVLVTCSACGASLRLPAGKRGMVRCPSCSARFEAST